MTKSRQPKTTHIPESSLFGIDFVYGAWGNRNHALPVVPNCCHITKIGTDLFKRSLGRPGGPIFI